jgi:hypothetical protein
MAIKRLSGREDNVAANGVIELAPNTISASFTFPAGYNGTSTGPVVIADNVTITLPAGTEWEIQ